MGAVIADAAARSACHSVTILALDPSTDVTGAVVLYVPARGDIRLLAYTAKDARHGEGVDRGSDMAARIARIRWTRRQLAGFLTRFSAKLAPGRAINLIAYETDTERGHDSSEALKMAAGAYLSLTMLDGLRVVPVTRQAACIVAGCHAVYRQSKGKTAKEQADKKRRLKDAVRKWAVTEFPKLPANCDDAISDALAVAMYAGLQWRHTWMIAAAETRPLMGPGSRGGKV